MYNPFSLENKTILVTGASSGIGRAIAIECSKMGAKVIISARNEQRLNETLLQMNGTHSIIVADLSNENDRSNLIEQLPTLDGLVNCAGLTKTLPFQFMNADALESVMNVNFTAPTLITASLIKKKKLIKGASIVFISSVSGVFVGGSPAGSIYSASKGAINGMARNMAIDLADKNIRVNCVNPGMIDTAIFDEGVITAEQLEEDRKRYPLKRYGKPEEVAYAVIYLLSDASQWVTGSNLLIDGGYTLN